MDRLAALVGTPASHGRSNRGCQQLQLYLIFYLSDTLYAVQVLSKLLIQNKMLCCICWRGVKKPLVDGGCSYPAQTQAQLHCHHPHYSAGGCWRLHPPAQLCNVSWRNVSTQTCHHLYTDTLHQQCRLGKYEIVLILNAIAVVSTQFWLEPLNLDK